MESSFNRAAEKVYGKSKTGLIEVNISRDPSTFELSARVVPRVNTKIVKQLNAVKKNQTKRGLAHADSDDEFGLDLLVTTDEDGFMVEFDVPDLEHFDSAEEFLAHYGVKGMKWGRRRTDAQLERAAAEREAGSDSGTSGSGSTKSDVVSIDAAEAAFTEHMLNKYGAQSVSNAQLQSYVNRRQLEERYEATKPKAPPKPESKLKPAKEFMSKLVADVAKEQITRVAKARAALEVERRLAKNAKNSELVDRIKPKDKKKKD